MSSDSVGNCLKGRGFFMTDGSLWSQIPINCRRYMASEIMLEIGFEVSNERTPAGVVKEIREYDFYGYSSMFLFMEDMDREILIDVSNAIEENKTLKYVTKLIVFYELQNFNATVIFNMEKHQTLVMRDNYKPFQEAFVKNMKINYLTFLYSSRHGMHDVGLLLFYNMLLENAKQRSIQEIVEMTYGDLFRNRKESNYHYSCNVGCYLYNINPALAIIINHYSFPNELEVNVRSGSLQDVEALQKAFRSKKISYISLEDGNREDVVEVMHRVRTTKFNGLKNFFILIMSHGDEGDIIYTKTGSYSIRDDIVAPLMENTTLAHVQKFVIVNACRGIMDPRFDLEEEVEELRNTLPDSNSMYPNNDKLMMIFSTQKGFISLLFKKGAIFVQKFCDLFLQNFDEISMEKLGEQLQELMMEEVADIQIPDFGTTDGQTHSIKMEFVNFFNNDKLLNDLESFFKKHLKNNMIQDNSYFNKMVDERSYLRDETDRGLLGIGYVDGVRNQSLTKSQKLSIERYIEEKEVKLLKTNDVSSSSPVTFEWSMDGLTGRNRFHVLRKT